MGRRWWVRPCAGTVLLLLAGQVDPAALPAQAGREPEQALFEVRVGRLAEATLVVLLGPDGQLFLPLARIASLAEYQVDPLGAGTLRLVDPSTADTVIIDASQPRVTRGALEQELPPAALSILDNEILGSLRFLQEVLRIRSSTDWTALTISLERTPPFPGEVRRLTEARLDRARNRMAMPAHSGRGPLVEYPTRSGGAVFGWSASSSLADPLQQWSWRPQLGLAVLGGDLTLGGRLSMTPQRGSSADGTWSYRRVWPNSGWLRQAHAGHILAEASVMRSLLGARITNAPLRRDVGFSSVTVQPDVPAGWSYEVYQDGQLIGFSAPGSEAPVAIPMRYGTTPVEVRMYSPTGEETSTAVEYQVPYFQLPPGKLEYDVGAGRCSFAACRFLSYGDLSYGARDWLTLSGGVEVRGDSSSTRTAPYGTINLSHVGGWFAQLSGSHREFGRVAAGHAGAGPVAGTVTAGLEDHGAGRPTFLASAWPRWFTESAVHIRGSRLPVSSVRLGARVEGERDGGMDRWRASAGAGIRRTSLTLEYARGDNSSESAGVTSVSAFSITPTVGPEWLRSRFVHAALSVAGANVVDGALGFSVALREIGQLGISGHWSRARGGAALVVDLSSALPSGRAQARAMAQPGRVSGQLFAEGGFTLSRSSGLVPTGSTGLSLGGISGMVFYDHDADGRLGPGDSPAAAIPLRLAGRGAITDHRGRFAVWDVAPYEITVVAVDTLQTRDPSWVPLRPAEQVRATPHMYNLVEIPLVRTTELAGRLEASPGVAEPAGVTLRLRETTTGEEQTLITFSNGEFYLSRLRPGRYEIRIAEPSLRALRAQSAPVSIQFTVSATGQPTLELEPFRLQAAASGGAPI